MRKQVALFASIALLLTLGFVPAILSANAGEPTAPLSDDELIQHLIARSPWKGSWNSVGNPYGTFSGTYDLVFREDGKKLRAFVENTKYIQAPPAPFDKPWDGETTFLKVKKGKVSFATPDSADVELTLAPDGKLTGSSWTGGRYRVQNQHTLVPAPK